MKTWLSIANMMGIVCLMILVSILCRNIELYEDQYNEQRLIKSMEYSAEAAFINSIGVEENLTNYGSVLPIVLTNETIPTFCDVMELNYDMSKCEANDVAVEESIGAICLMANDGYYITDTVEVRDAEFRQVWSPKLPYSVKENPDVVAEATTGAPITVAVTLDSNRWWATASDVSISAGFVEGMFSDEKTPDTIDDKEKYKAVFKDRYPLLFLNEDKVPSILNRSLADNIVSTSVTNALSYRLANQEGIGRNTTSEYSLIIPSLDTYAGINQVRNPSLIVVINNAKYSAYKGKCAAMQGLKVTWKPRILRYDSKIIDPKTGKPIRYYCYEGQNKNIDYDTVIPYNSEEDAARAGCCPDIESLMNPIRTSYDN